MAFTWNQSITGAITTASINELKEKIDIVKDTIVVCGTHYISKDAVVNTGQNSTVFTSYYNIEY